MWTHPPFDAGHRGRLDVRPRRRRHEGRPAANLFALDALPRIGLQPAATVYVQSVVEEESTGNGALMTHLRGYKADAALIPEPEEEKLVRGERRRPVVRGRGARHARCMSRDGQLAPMPSTPPIVSSARCAGSKSEWNERSTAPAFRRHRASDQSQHRQDRGRRLGLLRAGLVPGRLPHRDLSRRARRPTRRARSRAGVAAFARADRFLANNPPKVTFNGFFAEGYVLEPGSEAERVPGRGA